MIKCLECGKEFLMLAGHLKQHKLTVKDYREKYPGCKTIDPYADRRWSFGNLYTSLGFKFISFSAPSYWYMKGYFNREHRSNYMKHTLVSKGASSLMTEWEIMKSKGYDRIWDCGTLKFRLELT